MAQSQGRLSPGSDDLGCDLAPILSRQSVPGSSRSAPRDSGRRQCSFPLTGPQLHSPPVLILQHANFFERENPCKHKNAAIADGFCLLVFLKMALAVMRSTSRDDNGDLKSQLELAAQ
jgi:hypothetical protein